MEDANTGYRYLAYLVTGILFKNNTFTADTACIVVASGAGVSVCNQNALKLRSLSEAVV